MHSLLPLSLFLATTHVFAVRFPFEVRIPQQPSSPLARRASIPVGNTGNAQYVTNITVAGDTLPVLLDTGSSDLWVHFERGPTNPGQIQDTGKEVSLTYAIGRAQGTARRAEVEFAGYTIRDQAFLLVEDASGFSSNFAAQGHDGLFGVGPNSGSAVRKKLDKENADTVLQNIFNNADLGDNYITVLLDRKKDPTDPFTGEMTISEIIPEFQNITSAPKLDVDTVIRLLKSDQHWQALTDKDNSIIGPDGLAVKVDSIVPGAPDGQLVAVIDTGFTFSQVPREVADQIYGRVKGAVYDTANEWWLVPCGQYLNIAFNFGGDSFPVHPLDVVDDNFSKTDASGKRVCIGSFQPITTAFSMFGHYDMILGMNFLRSAYSLYNFGSWIDRAGTDEHPYIQMISHTDVDLARSDFVQIRLNGEDTIDSAQWQLLPFDQMQKSPVSEEEKKKKYQEMIISRWPYILLGCLAFVFICLGLCIWKCCCNKNKKKGNAGEKGGIASRFGFGGNNNKSLEDAYNSGGLRKGDSEAHLPLGKNASAIDLTRRQSDSSKFEYSHNTYSHSQQHLAQDPFQQPPHSPHVPPSPGHHQQSFGNQQQQHPAYPQQSYSEYRRNDVYGQEQQYEYQNGYHQQQQYPSYAR